MIENKDILEWCKTYAGQKFHAVLCDPPYELGFMGKSWDSTGIAFDKETWRSISKHLYPGAYLLAFGGTRTFHRIAVAIEDAGFEIRDTAIFCYGSGFPKSHNVGKAVDKAEGNERDEVGENPNARSTHGTNLLSMQSSPNSAEHRITKGNSPWEGYGSALKPAYEPIVIARLPLEGTIAQNAQKYGSGALNIDGCRVGTEEELGRNNHTNPYGSERTWSVSKTPPQNNVGKAAQGRWPANLIHDGSPEVVGMFPNSKDGVAGKRSDGVGMFNMGGHDDWGGYGGSGSAARFFKSCPLDDPEADIKRIAYHAKVSKKERDSGLDGFDVKQSRGGGGQGVGNKDLEKVAHAYGSIKAPAHNHHPTLKPISLTKYLATLILPPKLDGPRRLLVPFAGSGSEVIGGFKAGWDEVVGVEQSKEYCEIAEARIKYWTKPEEQQNLL